MPFVDAEERCPARHRREVADQSHEHPVIVPRILPTLPRPGESEIGVTVWPRHNVKRGTVDVGCPPIYPSSAARFASQSRSAEP
jgi:hypothetical protein